MTFAIPLQKPHRPTFFFRPFFHYCLRNVHNCADHIHICIKLVKWTRLDLNWHATLGSGLSMLELWTVASVLQGGFCVNFWLVDRNPGIAYLTKIINCCKTATSATSSKRTPKLLALLIPLRMISCMLSPREMKISRTDGLNLCWKYFSSLTPRFSRRLKTEINFWYGISS